MNLRPEDKHFWSLMVTWQCSWSLGSGWWTEREDGGVVGRGFMNFWYIQVSSLVLIMVWCGPVGLLANPTYYPPESERAHPSRLLNINDSSFARLRLHRSISSADSVSG